MNWQESSVDPDQLASIADEDLHLFQLSKYLVGSVFKEFMHGISKVSAKH